LKYYVVTGASRGIGREVVLKLANLGHHVFALARNTAALEQLQEASKNITSITVDLTKSQSIENAVAVISSKAEQLDGLLNNAGVLINKPFLELAENDWQQMLNGNILSAAQLIQKLHPLLKRGSHILNISSMGGFQGSQKFAGLSAYSASKGALAILTEALAEEFKDDQIKVNCLCLGAVQTEMLAEAFPDYHAPLTAVEMGHYVAESLCSLHHIMNGKILPIALTTP
jgi:NAD(P)-dependent dehydrogenase (short-subunit alcohol dehydrogenase family)